MSDDYLWWRDGIIYQIYPRSFADSNNDGIGDLPGITSRLDYLADLGVDAIWLSPIYPSPDADFGYDVSNYVDIDPRYGSLKDFDVLVKEAHKRKIHIVLDMVFNHSSNQHPWFQASSSSKDNPYSDWYLWRDPKPGGKLPNNWQSVFGGNGWVYESRRGQYYFHLFVKEQPDLNWHNPRVKEAIFDVMRFWLDRGADGFRLDVFSAYFKRPDFPDNPPKFGLRGFDRQHHIYDSDQPEMMPLLTEMRALLDSYPERYAVGEPFMDIKPAKAAYYCQPGHLHAVFNFEFTHSRWNPRQLLKCIQDWEAALHPETFPNYVLNNHDLPRTATRYRWKGNDAPAKVAATLLLTLRGTPFMYYGEEIGMEDISLRYDQIVDPPGKRFYPFYKGRDGCRSPMQWDDSSQAGFTNGKPWLPVHPNYRQRNVKSQTASPGSLLNFVRQLIALRRKHPALHRGAFIPITLQPRRALAYLRRHEEETVLIILNFSGRKQKLCLDQDFIAQDSWEVLLTSHKENKEPLKAGEIILQPYQVSIYLEC